MRSSKLTLGVLLLLAASQVQAQIVVTINAPGVQASTVAGVTTENFNSFAPGTYTSLNTAIGTYTSPGMAIAPADPFGGAGGSGSYFAMGLQSGQYVSSVMLNGGSQGYFGLWMSGQDAYNVVQLYQGATLVYNLDMPGLMSFIQAQPNAAQYMGNPNNGQDPTQLFAYVNFFGTNGTVFDKVVIDNSTTATGFESDNHSAAAAAAITGTVVTFPPSVVYDPADGHYYERVDTGEYSWQDAVNAAAARTYNGMQGHLVTITSQAENDFIVNNLGGDLVREKWTGAYQVDKNNEPAGDWAWITGEAWNYTNWADGEPNNLGGVEDTMSLKGLGYPLGSWNDVSLSGYAGYLVEYEAAVPEPGSLALLVGMGVSGVGFLVRRRRQAIEAA